MCDRSCRVRDGTHRRQAVVPPFTRCPIPHPLRSDLAANLAAPQIVRGTYTVSAGLGTTRRCVLVRTRAPLRRWAVSYANSQSSGIGLVAFSAVSATGSAAVPRPDARCGCRAWGNGRAREQRSCASHRRVPRATIPIIPLTNEHRARHNCDSYPGAEASRARKRFLTDGSLECSGSHAGARNACRPQTALLGPRGRTHRLRPRRPRDRCRKPAADWRRRRPF